MRDKGIPIRPVDLVHHGLSTPPSGDGEGKCREMRANVDDVGPAQPGDSGPEDAAIARDLGTEAGAAVFAFLSVEPNLEALYKQALADRAHMRRRRPAWDDALEADVKDARRTARQLGFPPAKPEACRAPGQER